MTGRSSNWDLGRFVKTLSYFGAVPLLSQIDWFQQWFGSRPDPTVDSRSLSLTPMPVSAHVSAMPQTILILGSGNFLTALIDRFQPQGNPIRAVSLNETYPPERDGVEWVAIDLNQTPAPAFVADVQAVICATEAESLVGPAVRFLIQAGQALDSRLPIFEFNQPSLNLSEIWGALDDVVMGGVSQSGIRFNGNFAEFSGQVSTANSGGFASVRTRNLEPPIDLSDYDGIELCLKGDGNRYKFMLRGETQWDGVAHCASFDTIPDRWITVRLPFADLIPVFRARTLQETPLNRDRTRAFQLMLSKFEYDGGLNPHFQPGFFQLQVQSIAAYRQQHRSPIVLISPPNPEAELLLRQSGLPVKILHPVDGEPAAKIAEAGVEAIESFLLTPRT